MLGKQDKGNKLLTWEELADQKSFYLLKLSPALIIGRQNFNCTVIPVIKSGFIPALVICSTLMITAVSVWYVIFVSFVPFLTLCYVLKTHFEPLKSSLSPADLYLWMNWNWSKCFYNSIFFLLAGHLGFFFSIQQILCLVWVKFHVILTLLLTASSWGINLILQGQHLVLYEVLWTFQVAAVPKWSKKNCACSSLAFRFR